MDVDVRIRIKLVFDHWGPHEGAVNCGCCAFLGFDIEPRKLTVILEGEWCGPIPFGNRDTFLGYMPLEDRIYPGRQNPVSGSQIQAPEGTFPRGSCANLFVDQGLYSDDPFIEPPKRCPSWEGDTASGGGNAPTQFWCPPKLNWKWSMSGGGTHWSDTNPTLGANKHQLAKQCWAAQLVKGSCPGGSIMFDQFEVRGCDDPNCRRGCSVTEDTTGDPCDASTPRSTPWGCGQCQV